MQMSGDIKWWDTGFLVMFRMSTSRWWPPDYERETRLLIIRDGKGCHLIHSYAQGNPTGARRCWKWSPCTEDWKCSLARADNCTCKREYTPCVREPMGTGVPVQRQNVTYRLQPHPKYWRKPDYEYRSCMPTRGKSLWHSQGTEREVTQ